MKRVIALLMTLLVFMQLITLPASAAKEYRSWLQSDPRWGSISFGSVGDTISSTGCAITAVAKLLVHSGAVVDNESKFNPGIFCEWLKKTGGVTSQGLIIWSAAHYDANFAYYGAVALTGTTAQKTALIKSYYDDGYVIVVSTKNHGHYVAVDKVTSSTVYIMDSANTGYTKLFQYDAAAITQMHIYKGPHNGSGDSASDTPKYDTTIVPSGVGSYSITSDDGVNLRSGAGTSYDILTAIPYNTVVNVTKVKNGWGYTTYDGKKGWFLLEYGKLTQNTLRAVKVTVLPTKTTYLIGEQFDPTGMVVRAYYADGSAKTLSSGYTINEFSSAKAGSCDVYVTYKTKSFMFTVTIEEPTKTYETGFYVVNSSDGIHLREQASTSSASLGVVSNKTQLKITETKKNWGKTIFETKSGWVCLDYTKQQTDLAVTPLIESVTTGQTVTEKDFKVTRVFADGTKQKITDFTVRVASNLNEGRLPVRVLDGGFSQKFYIPVVDLEPSKLTGDCDLDGAISAGDALGILQHVVGKTPDEFAADLADVDGDQSVTASDALMVLQFVVGKIQSFA